MGQGAKSVSERVDGWLETQTPLRQPGEMSRFLCFDRLEVINLPARRDRRAEVEKELARLGLAFGDGTTHLLAASSFADAGGFPTVGARGCFMSHLRALRQAQEAGTTALAILEDDCDFVRNPRTKFAEVGEQLHARQWDVFYGGYLEWAGSSRAADAGDLVIPALPDEGILGSHFVSLSARAVDLLVPYFEAILERPPGSPIGGPMHVDAAYSWFRRDHPELVTLVACPPLAVQRPSRTDIHQLRFYDRLPIARDAMTLARRIKRALRH